MLAHLKIHWKEFGQGSHLTLYKMNNLPCILYPSLIETGREPAFSLLPLTLSRDHFASDLNVDKDHQTSHVWEGFQNSDFLLLASLCGPGDCDQDKSTTWFLTQKGEKPTAARLFLSANSGSGCEPRLLGRISPECTGTQGNKTNGWNPSSKLSFYSPFNIISISRAISSPDFVFLILGRAKEAIIWEKFRAQDNCCKTSCTTDLDSSSREKW